MGMQQRLGHEVDRYGPAVVHCSSGMPAERSIMYDSQQFDYSTPLEHGDAMCGSKTAAGHLQAAQGLRVGQRKVQVGRGRAQQAAVGHVEGTPARVHVERLHRDALRRFLRRLRAACARPAKLGAGVQGLRPCCAPALRGVQVHGQELSPRLQPAR